MTPAVVLAAIAAAGELVKFINTAITASKQSKEWTPEEEAAVDARLRDMFVQEHWKPGKISGSFGTN